MYTSFFNLEEKPFDPTPSPRFLYLGEIHKEALSLLTYGLAERKGFVLLTGEAGTGKTAVVQAFLQDLGPSVRHVYLADPTLPADAFLSSLASGLGLKAQLRSKASFLIQFEHYFRKFYQHHITLLFVVDNAEKISVELLEEIRLLSNIETAEEKLICIILVGRPGLNEKLRQPLCRALFQRITIRYHLTPLDLKGTEDYIATRLSAAGAQKGYTIFPKRAVKAIYRCSRGYPKMINMLADHALACGYVQRKIKISPSIVEQTCRKIGLSKNGNVLPVRAKVGI